MQAHLSLSSTVLLTPRRAALKAGHDNTLEVLVRIQAPEAPAGHEAARAPHALALVIDRSGSMAGRPLAEARRCADSVISRLRPTDRVAAVAFDNQVRRLQAAEPLGDGTRLRAAIASIESGGATHLHGGWLAGAQALADVGGSGLKRVILLSDGQANEGETDTEEIARQCAQWAARGVSTSTYGLGAHFNEELMVAMGRAGAGNHYYGESAEDLMEPFQQELELLGNLCLRELRLAVQAGEGAAVTMLNAVPEVPGGWRLTDLAWGAEAWAVLRIHIPAAALMPPGRLLTVLRVHVSALGAGGSAGGNAGGNAGGAAGDAPSPVVELERAGLALPVLPAAEYEALAEDELVLRRLGELAAADMMARMHRAADAGEWAAVEQLLAEATRQFAGNEWVATMLAGMRVIAHGRDRERMKKESLYASGKLHSRLAEKDEDLRYSVSEAMAKPAYLRRKPAQGKGEVKGEDRSEV